MNKELASILGHLNYRGHREYVEAIKNLNYLSNTAENQKCAMKLHAFKNFVKVAEKELFEKSNIYSENPTERFLKPYVLLLRLKREVRESTFTYKQKPSKGGDFVIHGYDLVEEDLYIVESRRLTEKKLSLECITEQLFDEEPPE